MFSIKFIPNINATFFFCSLFLEFTQEKYKENEINRNKKFQAIGKTQPGGVIEGFIEEYHSVLILLEVNKLPIPPTIKKTISRQIMKTPILNFLFFI